MDRLVFGGTAVRMDRLVFRGTAVRIDTLVFGGTAVRMDRLVFGGTAVRMDTLVFWGQLLCEVKVKKNGQACVWGYCCTNGHTYAWRQLLGEARKNGQTSWTGMTRAAQNRVQWRGVVDGLRSTGSDGQK